MILMNRRAITVNTSLADIYLTSYANQECPGV
jgi:hypothetical protein